LYWIYTNAGDLLPFGRFAVRLGVMIGWIVMFNPDSDFAQNGIKPYMTKKTKIYSCAGNVGLTVNQKAGDTFNSVRHDKILLLV
jgi:hypothetical protein